MKTDPTATQLAKAFSEVLREWLAPKQMAEVNKRNLVELASDAPDRICHSHDFCDANQAILDGWQKITGTELDYDASNEEQNGLIDEAWKLAKRAKFNPEKL